MFKCDTNAHCGMLEDFIEPVNSWHFVRARHQMHFILSYCSRPECVLDRICLMKYLGFFFHIPLSSKKTMKKREFKI